MGKTWTIYKRELGEYFNSPIAYIAIVAFLVVAGFFGLRDIFGAEPPRAEMRPFFDNMPWILIGIAPALAMRLLSEEKSTGTLELLITFPVSDWHVVMGKWLASLTVLVLAILFTLPFPITVGIMGDLDWGVTTGAYLGLILMGACYLGISLMTSSWARNQVISFIFAAGLCLVFWGLGSQEATAWMPEGTATVFRAVFGLGSHFENISKGILDSRDVIYYLSVAAACLLLAVQSLESRKWR